MSAPRTRATHFGRLLVRAGAGLLLAALVTSARAAEELKGPLDTDPKLPAIPDPGEIELTPDEWADVEKGEIVVQIIERSKETRQARAIGYLKHNPAQLFDVVTDPTLAPRLVPEVEEVQVLETTPSCKRFHGSVDFSLVLPTLQYTMLACYDASRTGQSWAQTQGDLDKHEGSHAFFWDPERQQTLSVFTYETALKGVLSLIPEWVVIRLASRTLPSFLRNLDGVIDAVHAEDPPRGERVAKEWAALEPRLEASELSSRLWHPPTAHVSANHR